MDLFGSDCIDFAISKKPEKIKISHFSLKSETRNLKNRKISRRRDEIHPWLHRYRYYLYVVNNYYIAIAYVEYRLSSPDLEFTKHSRFEISLNGISSTHLAHQIILGNERIMDGWMVDIQVSIATSHILPGMNMNLWMPHF